MEIELFRKKMKLQSILLSIISISFSLAGVIFLQNEQIKEANLDNSNTKDLYERQEASEKVILGIQREIPNLGFSNLLADWNYLNFIQYFGDRSARLSTGYDLTPLFFEVITRKDPQFIEAILILSTMNSVFANRPLKTIEILNQTLANISPEVNPLSPYVWSYKGVDEILFLGDLKAAQKSYEMAGKWALLTNPPDPILAQQNQDTAKFLSNNPDVTETKIGGWTIILLRAINKETEEVAIKQIRDLGGDVIRLPNGEFQVKFPEN